MPEEDLLREVVGDYKNDKDSKKNLNEESEEQELLNDMRLCIDCFDLNT